MSRSHCIMNNDSKLFCKIVDLNRAYNNFSIENDISPVICVRGRVSKYLHTALYCKKYVLQSVIICNAHKRQTLHYFTSLHFKSYSLVH